MKEISVALKYSTRPYPNGCFLSGLFPANFVPTIVMMELIASLKLLMASSTTAIEFANKPTIVLKIASKTFVAIPIILVLIITAFLF